jgi:LEA14-like dessication related protein
MISERPHLAAVAALLAGTASCVTMPNSDPLNVSVAGIEPLPAEGMELRFAVRVRVQNPNDSSIEYSGAALTLDLNGQKLASGVSSEAGTVPRYGEAMLTIPVTASILGMVRQGLSFMTDGTPDEVRYEVKGKLEAGLFGTKRFSDEGTITLQAPADRPNSAPQ